MCRVGCRYSITGIKEEDALVEINKTALYNFHSQMGGKIVPFAGYEMPVQYGAGIMQEHLFCRESSALFDVSHMGQIIVRPSMGRNDSVAEHLEKMSLRPTYLMPLCSGLALLRPFISCHD